MNINKRIYSHFVHEKIAGASLVFMYCAIFMTLVLASCGSGTSHKEENQQTSEMENDFLGEEESGSEFAKDFWSDYDFRNTALLDDASLSEQKFVDFISYLPVLGKDEAILAIHNMLDSASVNAPSFRYFENLYRHYLHDPNSPYRDDAYYGAVLEYMMNSEQVSATEKESYQAQFDKINKNMPGGLSSDFTFVNIFGAEQSFHDVQAPYKLLLFYDPDCQTCEMVINEIEQSEIFNRVQDEKKLHIVAIMPWNDAQHWKEHQSQISKKWTNGFDRKSAVYEHDLYDIQAFPSLYLVDKDNKVLIKDGDYLEIEGFFDRL